MDDFDLWEVCLTCAQLDEEDLICDRSGEAVLDPWVRSCSHYERQVNEE